MTFEKLSKLYFDNYKTRVSNTTYQMRARNFERAFKSEALLDENITKENIDNIEILLIELKKNLLKKYNNNTVRQIYYIIINIFELAISKSLISTNIAKNLKNVKYENRLRTIKVITKEQFYIILNNVNDTHHQEKIFLQLLFHTGLRHSEARALTWRDIDFENKTLTVNKSIHCNRFEDYILKDAKTKTSNRTIKLDDVILERLDYLKFVSVYNSFDDFVFNEFKFPTTSNFAKLVLKKACMETNLKVSTHGLRHSHATYLLRNNIDANYISKRLGHATVSFTLSTYTHLLTEESDDKITDLFL